MPYRCIKAMEVRRNFVTYKIMHCFKKLTPIIFIFTKRKYTTMNLRKVLHEEKVCETV